MPAFRQRTAWPRAAPWGPGFLADIPGETRPERIADAAVHILGLAAALIACVVLVATLPPNAGPWRIIALLVYAAGLLTMLGCSAVYNMSSEGEQRALLQRLDHSAIFAMIAGTYTPVAGIGIGGSWGLGLLGLVWTGALGGAALKLWAPARIERVSLLIYLALGWAGIAAFDPLLRSLSTWDLLMLLAGGLIYSLGVLFHLAERLPYHYALWHACVVVAAACHYLVVLDLARMAG
ncbi:PAQR family membrane homeostasis protein TrhA [Roseicella aerolata]|uniref:Hemolysin III family protein n=1 Tax=Roseicella aerolata TaxID=2883479 RepID=A0A9X1L9I2_9PROT|nr:hemolysin III family protein [Roseicella aerolata]MCB4824036.1 hemolysin III family protein [Roseicella aerolata]